MLQTDPSGVISWRAEHEPYGRIYQLRTGTSNSQPLRLPGQDVAPHSIEGAEENYNIFRWYQAGWGRYGQSDPIGLGGNAGINLFSYTDGSPLNEIDPLGLSTAGQAVDILRDFISGSGPADRTYGPADPRTQEMMHAPGVERAREQFLQDHCRERKIVGRFGPYEFASATFDGSATQHQVGAYSGYVREIQHGFALFHIDNSLNMWSLFYHQDWAPRKHPRMTPIFPNTGWTPIMGDIWQHFWWVERVCCR